MYLLVVFVFLPLLFLPLNVFAAADHVLINEVQISGSNASDEFVELYNPTDINVGLTGWRLVRGSSTGVEDNLVASISGQIASHGYFLIAHPGFTGSTTPDLVYSAASNNIPANGSVTLYSDAGVTLVDRVGFGTSPLHETATVDNPVSGGSAARVNDDDTDNNSVDFSLSDVSDPQNSSFFVATPTPVPTATPTEAPLSTPEPTATSVPTSVPTPIPEETVSPTEIPFTSPVSQSRCDKSEDHEDYGHDRSHEKKENKRHVDFRQVLRAHFARLFRFRRH